MRTKTIVVGKAVKEDGSFRHWSIDAPNWCSRGETTGPLPNFGVLININLARVDTDPIINAGVFICGSIAVKVERDSNVFSALVAGLVGHNTTRQSWS
jgi:hypothetical protein